MKNTTNVFLEGVITDQNPLTMPQTALTSALNATIITGNGNEGLLQNDMGNTLIKDSVTGNIMSLNNGFIPLGMKEHGGVLYIASYNPETKEGELGTIPSPIIAYEYSHIQGDENLKITDLKEDDLSDEILIDDRTYTSSIRILSDHIFHAGDKFVVILNLDLIIRPFSRYLIPLDFIGPFNLSRKNEYTKSFDPITSIASGRGWFRIKLLVLSSDGGDPIELTTIDTSKLEYYTVKGFRSSKYWYIDSADFQSGEEFNLNKTRTSGLFRTFPNIKSGKLAIQFEIEKPGRLDYLFNNQYKKNLPQLIYIKKIVNKLEVFEYYAAVHGFQYSNGICPIRPDKIKIESKNHTLHFAVVTEKDGKNLVSIDSFGSNTIEIKTQDYFNPHLVYDYPSEFIIDSLSDLNMNTLGNRSTMEKKAFVSIKKDGSRDFIISKYRPCHIDFNNYDKNNNDALFFVKLDSLDSDVELKVTAYTKQYFKEITESESYVKYDSYNLTKFNPIKEELAISNLIPETATQQLFIEKDGQEDYDIKLFNNVEEGKNACFLYDSITDRMLKFDTDSRKYVDFNRINYVFKNNETEIDWDQTTSEDNDFYSVEEYAALKTWIYPITTLKNSSAEDGSPGIIRNTRDEDYWFLTQNVPHYKAKKCLLGDELPTYKLPCQPEVHLSDNTVKHYLLPLRHYTDIKPYDTGELNDDIIHSYVRARLAKERALSYINQYGLKTDDLKKYSLFKTNLTCLYKNFGDFPLKPYSGLLQSDYNIVNDESPIDEDFFKLSAADSGGGELNIWREYNQQIVSCKYLPRRTQIQTIYGTSQTETRYWQMTENSSPWGTVIGEPGNCFRPYASSMVAKPFHGITDRGAVDRNDLLLHPASFLTFLVKSAPGFIHCDDKQHSVLNLEILNYLYPIKYLYKKDFYLNIENKGNSAVTTYYSKYANSEDGWRSMWKQDTTLQNDIYPRGYQFNFFTTSCVKIDDELKETILLGNDSFSEQRLNYFHEYNNDLEVNNVLGVCQGSTLILIPNNSKYFELKTKGAVRPLDEWGGDYYPSDDIEDSICIVKDGDSVGEAMVVPLEASYTSDESIPSWAWWGRQIAATNVLTALRCQLFVDKATSDLQYTNKSDFSIDYLLSLENNKGIWFGSGQPVLLETNINTAVNQLNPNPGEIENMNYCEELTDYANNILKNSFINDSGYIAVGSGKTKKINLLTLNITLTNKLYVLNLNYNYCPNTKIELQINNNVLGSDYKNVLGPRRHTVLLYNPDGALVTLYRLWLTVTNTNNDDDRDSKWYIKNCGLYEVDLDSSSPASEELKKVIDSITWSDGLNIITPESAAGKELFKHIVMPLTFCFKEVEYDNEKTDVKKIGCLDIDYGGFQALPNHGYQQIGGVYYLNSDSEKALTTAYFNINTIPVEFNSDDIDDFIRNNIFQTNQLIIRHYA